MSIDVLTRSFDQARSGANTAETVLTPQAVRTLGVRMVLTLQTPDDPRLEAQPLYLSQLVIAGKARDVIIQATMANSIYAWDANTGALIWKSVVGKPITGSAAIDMHNINIKWGILSTPVIDRAANMLYACAWVSTDGSGDWPTAHHMLVALDIRTGTQVHQPLDLESTAFAPPGGLPALQFRSIERKQRSALALCQGAVIVCFGTVMETSKSARGWVIAVDTVKWGVAASWCSTAKGSGGGIWMSGGGPAIQSDGSIWVVTGNGSFDGVSDFGESVIRLRYAKKTAAAPAQITVAGWWTPWTDVARTRIPPSPRAKAALAAVKASGPTTNFRIVPHLAALGIPANEMGDGWGDQDLGASGIVLMEDLGVALVSSKDGILYTIKLASPGSTAVGDLTIAASPANYRKLAAPPILYTFFDPAINPATPDPTQLNVQSGGMTHHLHGTPVAWASAAHGRMHFCGGENGNLRAWSIDPASKGSTYLGCSAAVASALAGPKGGMPGWSISLSANGQADGIVWAMIPYGDANLAVTKGRLIAYDASHLATFNGGSGEIVPLWDSQDWNWDFLHPKFNRPIAVDGRVIVPTYDGRVLVLKT